MMGFSSFKFGRVDVVVVLSRALILSTLSSFILIVFLKAISVDMREPVLMESVSDRLAPRAESKRERLM